MVVDVEQTVWLSPSPERLPLHTLNKRLNNKRSWMETNWTMGCGAYPIDYGWAYVVVTLIWPTQVWSPPPLLSKILAMCPPLTEMNWWSILLCSFFLLKYCCSARTIKTDLIMYGRAPVEANKAKSKTTVLEEWVQRESYKRLELAASLLGLCLIHQPVQGQAGPSLGEPDVRSSKPIRACLSLHWARWEWDLQAKWPLLPDHCEAMVR